MKPFFKNPKKIKIFIFNVLLLLVSSYYIWQSEKFQQRITPKKYWQSKINTFESELKKDNIKIKSLKLDLEKENTLCLYYEDEAKIKAEEKNENINDIYFKIENEHIKKIDNIKNEINELLKKEKKIKKELNIAYNRLKILN